MKLKHNGLIYAHLSVLLFGATGIFGKLIPLPSPIIVFGRVFFASLFVALILIFLKQSFKLKKKSDYWNMLILGLMWAINLISFFKSVQVSTVAIGVLSFSTFPIFTTFLEPFFFKEKLKLSDIIVVTITMLGVIFVIPEFKLTNNIVQGVLWGMASGLSLSLLSIFSRKHAQNNSSLIITFYQNFFATILLIPFLFILKPNLNQNSIVLLLLLGTLFSAIPHLLIMKSLSTLKAQTISIILSLESVYGIIFAIFIINEIPTIRVIAGGVLILGATFYATIKARKQLPIPE